MVLLSCLMLERILMAMVAGLLLGVASFSLGIGGSRAWRRRR